MYDPFSHLNHLRDPCHIHPFQYCIVNSLSNIVVLVEPTMERTHTRVEEGYIFLYSPEKADICFIVRNVTRVYHCQLHYYC